MTLHNLLGAQTDEVDIFRDFSTNDALLRSAWKTPAALGVLVPRCQGSCVNIAWSHRSDRADAPAF